MKFGNKLELLYVPATYWNEPFSNFELISKENQLPQNTNFFLLWIPLNQSEKKLIEQIKLIFPMIPTKKLLTCKINLAIPPSLTKVKENNKSSKKYYDIITHIGKIIPISPATKLLYQLEIIINPDRSKLQYTNSIKTWAFLTKLLFELLNKGQFVPVIEPTTEKLYTCKWRLILKSQYDKDRFNSILNKSFWSAFCLPTNFFHEEDILKTDGLWHPSYIFSTFLDDVGDHLIRSILYKANFQTFKEFYSTEIKKEVNPDYIVNWDYKFIKGLIKKESIFNVDEFYETVLPILIRNWTQYAYGFQLKHDLAINLELKYPDEIEGDWPLILSLLIQNSSKKIPLNEIWDGIKLKKDEFAIFFGNDEDYLELILRALGIAAKIFPPIKRAFLEKIQHEIRLSPSEVMDFLKYPKDLLIQNGFNVILPEVFAMEGTQRVTAKLIIRSKDNAKKKGRISNILPSVFDINSLLETKWEVRIEGKEISDDEFIKLIESDDPLVNLRGKWILVDQNDVEDLRNIKNFVIESYLEALKVGLIGKVQVQENGAKYNVILEGGLRDIVNRMQSIDSFEDISCPSSFKGKLRHYQKDALNWMGNMTKFNFGLCLADDMGLGKTIQVIAFLLYLKEEFPNNPGSNLIVCPTSILFNWYRELKKFAPDLVVILHHGPNRYKKASDIPKFLKSHRIFLTSYGTIRNDIEFLETIQFNGVIIDESQNMKNYTSKQTQAIYKLKSRYRICLSGTPIENHLLELWSLFNFLNPGLLGTRQDFQKKFVLPIERFQDQEAIENLKLIIAPFIMRRLKSEKSIIQDLPEKNEIKIIIELTEEQKKLYKNLTEEILEKISNKSLDNRQKRGLILSLLVKLKQICNHPYQYQKKDIRSIREDKEIKKIISQSNKLERLLEMTDEVISNGEKVLIFTQFTKMGSIIKNVLEWQYNFNILYFHGSVPENKRRTIIDDFQSEDSESPPILILSLKAGGTGLNLTQGTTVIHFDRWWNPAVEDQATDRAYRIGQKSVVNVYKFVTNGSIEEKIDSLLEEKRELSEKIVSSSGESWISDLDDDKLKELLLLST
ncbi:MAG: DEAD/DEAH box helicase [Promethearchaeota archaeon]